ncbi:class I SAM-dependent methyltransferase [Myroides fluvii]|uniref:class I SAM-dependent methyltransferase n=1 Tax=Myroides fluvii TaxID=2572594 RepID=UPI00131A8FEC|nr:class I SAM-dependent methyltransferase [Myroides fluvii]
MSQQFWEERYKQEDYVYGIEPNAFLKEVLPLDGQGKKMLFVAEGEGRNAVYAATLGYTVDAFDLSTEAKKKAMRLASKQGVELQYDVCTVEDWPSNEAQYDGLVLIYAHFPQEKRRAYHRHLAQALKFGGMLILEAFSPKQIEQRTKGSIGGPGELEMLYPLEQLMEDFPSFQFHLAQEKEVELREGHFHQGTGAVIRLMGQKK